MLRRFSTYDGERDVDLEGLAVRDLGDLPIADLGPADAIAAVDAAVRELPADPVAVFLGGDNVVTAPIVAAHPAAPLARTGVLTFDAHHDVRTYDEVPSNGAPIRWLLDQGLPGDQVVQIGIHGHANSRAYRRFCDDHGIRVVTVAEVERRGIEAVVAEALDDLAGRTDAIHVDLDIDVLDRSFVPGCPGARPGGLTPRQLTAAAHRCGAHPAVRSLDLVEVDPAADVADLTAHERRGGVPGRRHGDRAPHLAPSVGGHSPARAVPRSRSSSSRIRIASGPTPWIASSTRVVSISRHRRSTARPDGTS